MFELINKHNKIFCFTNGSISEDSDPGPGGVGISFYGQNNSDQNTFLFSLSYELGHCSKVYAEHVAIIIAQLYFNIFGIRDAIIKSELKINENENKLTEKINKLKIHIENKNKLNLTTTTHRIIKP